MIFVCLGLIIMLLIVVSVSSVNAYIDPNTGGFFFQTVAPFIYGILAAVVIFWRRITGFVKGLFSSKKGQSSSVDNE